MTYTSGDAVGIYPENNPAEVTRLIKAMHVANVEQVTAAIPTAFAFYKTRFSGAGPIFFVFRNLTPRSIEMAPLRDVLTLMYDMKTVKPELLELLQSSRSTSPIHVATIQGLLAAGKSLASNRPLADYCNGHEVADILIEFDSARPTVNEILANMRALQVLPLRFSFPPLSLTTLSSRGTTRSRHLRSSRRRASR